MLMVVPWYRVFLPERKCTGTTLAEGLKTHVPTGTSIYSYGYGQ